MNTSSSSSLPPVPLITPDKKVSNQRGHDGKSEEEGVLSIEEVERRAWKGGANHRISSSDSMKQLAAYMVACGFQLPASTVCEKCFRMNVWCTGGVPCDHCALGPGSNGAKAMANCVYPATPLQNQPSAKPFTRKLPLVAVELKDSQYDSYRVAMGLPSLKTDKAGSALKSGSSKANEVPDGREVDMDEGEEKPKKALKRKRGTDVEEGPKTRPRGRGPKGKCWNKWTGKFEDPV